MQYMNKVWKVLWYVCIDVYEKYIVWCMWIIVNGNANRKVMASWLMILACVCDMKG